MTEPLKNSRPRKVRCPKCNTLLTEPSPETPIYQCFNCLKLLQVKHAVSSDHTKGNHKIKLKAAEIANIQEDEAVVSEAQAEAQQQTRRGLQEQINLANAEASDESIILSIPEIPHDNSEEQQLYRRRRINSQAGHVKSSVPKSNLPLFSDGSRSPTMTKEITIKLNGNESDAVSTSQLSPRMPEILQNTLSSATKPNQHSPKEKSTFSEDVSQIAEQKVFSSYVPKKGDDYNRKEPISSESTQHSGSTNMLTQQAFAHSSLTYQTNADNGVNDGEEDENVESEKENFVGRVLEEMRGLRLVQASSASVTRSPFNIRDIAKEEMKEKLEEHANSRVPSDDQQEQVQDTQAARCKFGSANHHLSSNRQQLDQEAETGNIQVEQKDNFGVTGTVVCSLNCKDGIQSGNECSSDKHIGMPSYSDKEQSNQTKVHDNTFSYLLPDGEQNVPAVEMVLHEAYSSLSNDSSLTGWNKSYNFNTSSELKNMNVEGELSNHQFLNKNESPLSSSFQFQLTQFNSVPQVDAHNAASSVADYPTSHLSTAPSEVDQLFALGKPDTEEERILNTLAQWNHSEKKGPSARNVTQLVDVGLTIDSRTHDSQAPCTEPSELVQRQRNESMIGRCQIPERGTDYLGYEQRRYHLQDDRYFSYVNQRRQSERNAMSAQRGLRNGDGVRSERMAQAKNQQQSFDRQFSDHSGLPVAPQQDQHLGIKPEMGRNDSEKVVMSISHGLAEHNIQLQSNKCQERLPQAPQSSTYSPWGSSQAGMIPMPSHNYHPLVCFHQPSTHPVCMFCVHQSHMQHHQHLHGALQHPCPICISQHMYVATAPPHQYWASCMPYHLPPSPVCHPGFILPENVSSIQQVQHPESSHLKSVEQGQYQEPVHLDLIERQSRKQRHYPLISTKFAVPYVICQHCDRLLKVPSLLPQISGGFQKLQCGACGNISKFLYFDSNNGDTMQLSVVKHGLARNDSVENLFKKDQVTSSKSHAAFPGSDAVTELAECDSPYLLDGHGKTFDESFAAWQKSDVHVKNFNTIFKDAQYHRIPHDDDGKQQLLEANSISCLPTQLNDNLSLTKYVDASRTGTQKQGKHTNASIPSDSYTSSLPALAVREGTSRNEILKNKASGFSRPSNSLIVNGSGSKKYEAYRKQNILGGSMDSDSSFEGKLLAGAANEPYSVGSSIIHESSSRESHSGGSFDPCNESQYMKENDLHSANVAVSGSPLHALFGYSSPSELLDSSEYETSSYIPAKIPYQRHKDLMFSRSVSVSYDSLPSMKSKAGLQILQQVSFETADFDKIFQQKDSPFGTSSSSRSFPRSPAGSPLYSNFPHDLSIDQDRGILQSTPKGLRQSERATPKGLRQSERDNNKGQRTLKGFFKKSLKELIKGQGDFASHQVMINGHAISDAVLKRVEKQAGTIHPGSYWYDFHAGFWGVMGGPCVGIIPPFIEDLNFPMPKDCAGGKTGILVNSRELHEKDLKLLTRRGLPIMPGKAYIVDIDGRVVDETSGLELKGLGKLAPTIQNRGQGFGMFQPSSVLSGCSQN